MEAQGLLNKIHTQISKKGIHEKSAIPLITPKANLKLTESIFSKH